VTAHEPVNVKKKIDLFNIKILGELTAENPLGLG
jgi:hypothetical protein